MGKPGLKRKDLDTPRVENANVSSRDELKIDQEKGSDSTISDYESLADIHDLRDDAKSCLSCWTKAEVARIIEPFLDKHPALWAMDSKRIELLERRLYPKMKRTDVNYKKSIHFFEYSLTEYNQHYRYPSVGCLRRDEPCIHLNDIYPLIQPLLECSSSAQWEVLQILTANGEEVSALDRVITFLKGRTAIDGRGVTGEADEAWWKFVPLWENYVVSRPWLQRILDPYWVTINIIGVAPSPGLEEAIAAYPPVGSNAPALLPPHPGNNFVIPFGTAQDARQFIGFLQGQCPGVTAFLTGNIVAPVIY
jgi:hypothetical protein